ncbi:MAG: ATP-binding cassette domain-containing protein [Alphaproteobacteria bacterium]|nr:ATP-binding cassette domain-containing protein [Alphaproteobacteria bacterium]
MPPAISVSNLTKIYRAPRKQQGLAGSLRSLFAREYDEVRAVDDLSFDIAPGERVGFLGPNGAGKTTTLKMLAGLLVPTSGERRVAGFDPSRRQNDFLRRITLVMGQKQQLLWDLPPTETFALNRALYGLDPRQARETLDELIALLELEPLLERPVRNLSLGERMKCELAAALLHRPEVLFLDEPTIGLDVRAQVTVRRFVEAWNARAGTTVLLTSHYMADIAALCPRVIVIAGGRLRYDGPLDTLVARYGDTRRVRVRTLDAVPAPPEPFRVEEGRLIAEVPTAEVRDVIDAALRKLDVVDLSVEEPPLERVMARLFEDSP